MIHSACVESWDAETGKARAPHHRAAARISAHRHARAAAGAIQRGHGRNAPGPAQAVNTFNLKTHLTAQWAGLAAGLQAHSTVKGSRPQVRRPIVMVAVGDARGFRTAQVSLGEQALALKPGTFHPPTAAACAVLPEACAARPSP